MNYEQTKIDSDCLPIARNVIDQEADSLNKLSLSLDKTFAKVITALEATRGRVIVSGIGKSGYIARKIAASLTSTGTPAYFIHPAEADHGDLGTICPDDLVIVLSNSGYTHELSNLIDYTIQQKSILVAITRFCHSPLAKKANFVLTLPRVVEACGTDTVPTTSTIMMLALGDAIVIALMQRRGFTPDHFRNLHPGGNLGARLSKVSEIMHCTDRLPLIAPHTLMRDALLAMTEKGFGIVGVISDTDHLVGVITDGDLRRHMDDNVLNKRADFVMTHSPLVILADTKIEQALAKMSFGQKKITCLFVVKSNDNPKPIGLVHIHDCLRMVGRDK